MQGLFAAMAANSTTASSAAAAGAPYLLTAVEVVLALAAIVSLGTLFTRITRRVALRAGASQEVVRAVDYWIAVLVLVVSVAAVAGITGFSSEFTTLTISGIGGLAATLALQTTLSNIISGILMLQDGVLRLGDEIEFGGTRGVVVRLSLRTTWIRRTDGVIVVVGNTNLASGPITNHTAKARLEKKIEI